MNRRLSTAPVVLVVAALGLVGCSSSSGGGSASAGGGAHSAAGSAAPAGSTGSGGGGGKVVNICALIPAATAAQLSGQPYTTAVVEHTGWTSECAYNNDDATAEGVNVNYSSQNATNTWNTVHTGSVTDVSGLGDKAFWDNDNTLYVLTGSNIIQVNGLSSQAKAEALAKPVIDALH